MEVLSFLAVAFLLHSALTFTDYLLKSCMYLPYIQLLQHTGLTIKPLQLRFCTTLFNRTLAMWALRKSKLHRLWFTVGAVVVLVLALPSMLLMVLSLVQWLGTVSKSSKSQHTSTDQHLLQPVVPGVNLSASELPLYMLTLLVASLVHEVGHALAAIKEGVHLDGVGLLLVFVMPGAFVMLPSDAIAALRPGRRLKILCAGVWHNIVLVLAAVLVAHLTPTLYLPLYRQGDGAIVTEVMEHSPARGRLGLSSLDVVTRINGCPVTSLSHWHDCLLDALVTPQMGYCIPETVVYNMDETVQHVSNGPGDSIRCCHSSAATEGGGDHLCFELLNSESGSGNSVPMHPFTCLPVRPALARSAESCRSGDDCSLGHFCLAPSLEDGVRLLRIARVVGHDQRPTTAPRHQGRQLAAAGGLMPEGGVLIRPYTAHEDLAYTDTTSDGDDHVKGRNGGKRYDGRRRGVQTKRTLIGTVGANETSDLDASKLVDVAQWKSRRLQSVARDTAPTNASEDKVTDKRSGDDRGRLVKRDVAAPARSSAAAANEHLPHQGDPSLDANEEPHDHSEDDVSSDFRDVLYLGSPALLYQTVLVSDYIPRFSFVSLGWAESSLKLCDYFIKFSGALALLNLVPCVYLDGQYIAAAVIEGALGAQCSDEARCVLHGAVTATGTALVLANMALGLYSLA